MLFNLIHCIITYTLYMISLDVSCVRRSYAYIYICNFFCLLHLPAFYLLISRFQDVYLFVISHNKSLKNCMIFLTKLLISFAFNWVQNSFLVLPNCSNFPRDKNKQCSLIETLLNMKVYWYRRCAGMYVPAHLKFRIKATPVLRTKLLLGNHTSKEKQNRKVS